MGLLLGGAIIAWHPQGLALVLVVMALQFCVEMLVMRNYATAVVFITGAALTLASGARRPLGRRRQRRHPARSRDPAARARARSAGTARVPHPRAAGARAHRGAVEWCAGGRTPLRTRTPCTPRSTTTPAAARRATRSR
ncbi:MAG: FUSC family protein [Gammaproteobacteria bacterium]|nr:FUSC family protein [Gammaproteobacteria bacterium]